MRRLKSPGIFVVMFLLGFIAKSSLAGSNDYFKKVNQVKAEASKMEASFYAPKAFEKAMDLYKDAEKLVSKRKKISRIEKKLDQTVAQFHRAITITKASTAVFKETAAARHACIKVKAARLAKKLWEDAEKEFHKGLKSFEVNFKSGNPKHAKNKGKKAEELYNSAELNAIKAVYLQAAWNQLKKAEEIKAGKYAPKTYEKARNLADKADKMLERDRYETGKVKLIADQAEYEAKHAVYLHTSIKGNKKADVSQEALYLKNEAKIEKIGLGLDEQLFFDRGTTKPVSIILTGITKLKTTNSNLQETVTKNQKLVTDLEKMNTAKDTEIVKLQKSKTQAMELVQQKDNKLTSLNKDQKASMNTLKKKNTTTLANLQKKNSAAVLALQKEKDTQAADLQLKNKELKKQITQKDQEIVQIKQEHSTLSAKADQEHSTLVTKRDREISLLKQKLASLEQSMGKYKSEKDLAKAKLERQAIRKEKAARISKSITKTEGSVVFDIDGNVIIRLYGLNFLSGKAEIGSKYYGLLKKVHNAIELFPKCQVIVEGHTDTQGTTTDNRKLSEKRASAVVEYIIANLNMPKERIKALGYGEEKPVASNETSEGRKKNRRIDVLILPAD